MMTLFMSMIIITICMIMIIRITMHMMIIMMAMNVIIMGRCWIDHFGKVRGQITARTFLLGRARPKNARFYLALGNCS